ncbi:MAG: cytochrome C oxidase subunit IV family protein [Candidatus Marinimicrobia bacterium]|jgi:cytochrome c oxidase subunit 4|nr:cytochrome C oxidase subunit IV family protein [Candidatus Neomarinimicrobiota bacterium]
MADLTREEVKHHVKTYIMVFVALAFFTIVTVAISYLDLGVGASVTLALIVASIKGSLVACYFMHLIDERTTIYWTLLATVAAFLILMFVPLSTMLDQARI